MNMHSMPSQTHSPMVLSHCSGYNRVLRWYSMNLNQYSHRLIWYMLNCTKSMSDMLYQIHSCLNWQLQSWVFWYRFHLMWYPM